MNPTSLDDRAVGRFWKHGWLVVRQLFNAEEFEDLRARVFRSLDAVEKGARPACDLLGDPELSSLVHDPRLVAAARRILGGDPVYFGDGSYAVVGRGYDEITEATGYHRDNTDRSDLNAPDWQGRYSLIRFGLYLQDHRRHSGGLMVRDASHNKLIRGWRAYLHDRYLNTAMGDVGVWSMRLQHAGVGRFLRGFGQRGISPALQKHLPAVLQSPRWDRDRAAIWISYGLKDHHLQRHLDYLYGRRERLDMWKDSFYTADRLEECRKAGLEVIDAPAELRNRLSQGIEVGQHQHHYQLPYG